MARFWIRGRKLWGARPAKNSGTHDNWCNGVDIVIHHTADAGPKRMSALAKATHMRAMQYFHQRVRGWSDIGYNYLIFNDGTVYEGRGFGIRGAHAADDNGNHNPDSCGIAFVGTYTLHQPSPAAIAAYRALLKRLRAHGATLRSVKAHGDLMPTACPGNGTRRALNLPTH